MKAICEKCTFSDTFNVIQSKLRIVMICLLFQIQGCLKVQKNNGYMEFLATLGDWVYYDCPVHHAFSEDDCTCILTGTSIYFIENSVFRCEKYKCY